MEKRDEEFLKKLLATFKVEAEEHLKAISAGVIDLEKATAESRTGLTERVYREAHSLKGAARSVDLAEVVAICQSLENVFGALKRGEISVSSRMVDVVEQAVECIAGLVSGGEVSASEKSVIKELMLKLESAAKGAGVRSQETGAGRQETQDEGRETRDEGALRPPGPEHRSTAPAISETVRISTAKLDSLLLQAEELLSVKLAASERAAELKDIKKSIELWKKEDAKTRVQGTGYGVQGSGGRAAVALMAEPMLASIETRVAGQVKAAEYDYRSFSGMVDNLLDDMKKALMLPFSSLLDIFPKFVRDLSRDVGKKVEFTSQGGEIEIDRRIMEEIKDPLIHLVRNCVDHGIEAPEERERKKKPAQGEVTISAATRDNRIEIEVTDDGAGIDAMKIKSAAVKQGLLTSEEADRLSDQEALLLSFRSGVTTSPIITDLSGRGLGLAIVREKVEKLNGTVLIDTRPDAGTTFKMAVPLTLATFRGTLIRAGGQLFVLPSITVERVARVKKSELTTVENREAISFNGRTVSLSRLADVLEMQSGSRETLDPDSFVQVVVLGSAERRIAFLVDEILMEQEVLVKPLGKQLSRVRNIAGATVLGNGKVVMILNVSDLMKSAVKATAAPVRREAAAERREKRATVLVVEDSITSRTLIKNILESAGYDVATSVDGADAFAALKTREFDLVVSDVEMPRMNGFELTEKIRSDKKLSELPVVLVTALDSREDRERGIDAGANAYIVKSSFEQSNLLEVLKRLV